jgi:hypothetical protein
MQVRFSKYVSCLCSLAFVALLPLAVSAQVTATPSGKTAVDADSPSKWDIFLGYSYLAPSGKITGIPATTPGSHYGQINWGGTLSIARYFNKNLGLQIEGDEHMQSEDWPVGDNNASYNSNDDLSGGAVGLIYRIPTRYFTPFVHVQVGGERVGSIYADDTWGAVATGGGGLDLNTPLFNHHLAVRIFQTDYQFIHADGGNINAFRLDTGLVFKFGSIAPPSPVTLVCSASPSSVYPGDPVTVTASAGSLNPRLNVIYTFTGTGVTASGTTATVATASLASGNYIVQCGLKEGRPGREGLKPWEVASSSASFTVKDSDPPTISCTASPTAIAPGETSTVTAVGVSPQNRPLTYSYTASAGTIGSSANTAVFSSAGAPTGTVAIACNVSDDKGKTATANTSVTITAPSVAPVPHTQALCSISFERDSKRPTRVDNEAKACLDDVALNLQNQPGATVVIVGDSNAAEKAHGASRRGDIAALRAVNTKNYLVTEKGIDASRVTVVIGSGDDQRVQDYVVPSGASFTTDVAGTTAVDESSLKAEPRKPLGTAPAKHHRTRKSAEESAAPTQ